MRMKKITKEELRRDLDCDCPLCKLMMEGKEDVFEVLWDDEIPVTGKPKKKKN